MAHTGRGIIETSEYLIGTTLVHRSAVGITQRTAEFT